jgi:hypothetical protein
MHEALKRRVAAIGARSENRLATLRRKLAADTTVIAGATEHARLMAEGELAGRLVIAPDEPLPAEPIL